MIKSHDERLRDSVPTPVCRRAHAPTMLVIILLIVLVVLLLGGYSFSRRR